MNKSRTNTADSGEVAESGVYVDSSPPIHFGSVATERLAELEIENSRLHRLVAELLIKNQQLRKPD